MSSKGTSLAPLSPQTVSIGMESTPSPSLSITPSIFRFLKSLDLRSLDLNPNMVSLVHQTTGWEIMVHDTIVAESRLRGNKCPNWLKSVKLLKSYKFNHYFGY